MRLSLRFMLPLMLALGLVAYAVRPLVDQLTLRWFVRDIEIRAALVANTIHEPLVDLVTTNARIKLKGFFSRIIEDQRLYAMAFCDAQREEFVVTRPLSAVVSCRDLDRFTRGDAGLVASDHGLLHVAVEPVVADGTTLGQLVLVHDMSFVQRRSEESKRYVFYFLVGLGALVSLITVVVAQLG